MPYLKRTKSLAMAITLSCCVATLCVAAIRMPKHSLTADKMTEAVLAFIATLDSRQRESLKFPLLVDERTSWSNLPILMVRSDGVLVGDLDDRQRRALHDLLRASLTSQGYAKASGIMRLDDLLHDIEAERLAKDPERRDDAFSKAFVATRGSGNYVVAVFGEPEDGDWGWKLTGHHLAVNFTVTKGRIGFTPMFVGSNPTTIESGPYAGWTALSHEASRGVDLLMSLTDEQRKVAIVDDVVADDVFEGPGRRASLSSYEGLKFDELSATQRQLFVTLIDEYVSNAGDDGAREQYDQIVGAGLEELWFSWRGPVDLRGEFYYRVHGPRLLIEYNRQDPTHDHAVVRDPQNDYGEDWLEHHYKEYHPSLDEALENARRRARAAGTQD